MPNIYIYIVLQRYVLKHANQLALTHLGPKLLCWRGKHKHSPDSPEQVALDWESQML